MQMINDALELVQPYLELLGGDFHPGTAPDGTSVLSTPFRFVNGDALEVAVWEENGATFLSDRGRLIDGLLLSGADPLGSDVEREPIARALEAHGAYLRGGTVIKPVEEMRAGPAIHSLIQSLVDAQAVGYSASRRAAGQSEPSAYATVRDVLDREDVRFRENMYVSGVLGRRYPVDFKLAFRRDEIIWAILVIVTDRTLESAERWNFRFRDIHTRRPRLRRLFVVDEQASWTDDAHRTIEQECEQVFRPGQAERLEEYLETASV